MTETSTHLPQASTFSLGKYGPIWTIYGLIFTAVTLAVLIRGLSLGDWMALTMGGVALVFALFKLFDVPAFAADFAAYDVVAARVPAYGKAYPFLEAGIGIWFLTGVLVGPLLVVTLVVFGLGLLGVWRALNSGQNLQCACVGKMFDLPLSRVALFENGLMVAMAAVMLLARSWTG